MATPPSIPTFIGRYRVERVLGRGAMGVIYQAEDPDIGRRVAIKLVRADLLDGDDREEFLTRFRHEARAAGRCMHPNIVAIHDFAMHDGDPFIAMEYVDGVPLNQALKDAGRFPPADAVAIVAQMLAALEVAHGLGIVHRDVKPANVLLRPDGQVKMTDFGISRMNTSNVTQQGAVIGTPAYMSPEQCRGETVDARSDLFSVGAVLYELLTGARAFNGRNATEVTYQVLSSPPRDIRGLADVPAALAMAVDRAMTKARDDRYASARQMADALSTALAGGDGDADADQTTVRPLARRGPAAPDPLDEADLDAIERRLARHVGPIARHLVRDAARRAASIDALCETLARGITRSEDRERFLAESLTDTPNRTAMTSPRGTVRPTSGTRAPANIPPERIEHVERALTRVLGPIAKVLVRRALADAGSEAALWEKLAARMERDADRQAFLRARGEG